MNSDQKASEPAETPSAADTPTDASTPASPGPVAAVTGSTSEGSSEAQPTASEPAAASITSPETPAAAPAPSEAASTLVSKPETSSSASSEPSSATDKDTSTEPKRSSPARMSLSFIQGDEPKKPEAKSASPIDGDSGSNSAPDALSVTPNAAANAAAAATESATPADESVTSETTVSAQESAPAATSPGATAPVDTADAAAVAADDADPVANPKEPKSLLKHAHSHNHAHKHHHHHHHHHRSFRNLKSKQDVNNKDVYSFVKATPFPKTDLGVLEYTTNLDTCLQGVLLPNLQLHVDCTVQVLIPRKHLRKESNLLVQRREIWGTDIYTDDSDIVSVLYHTGVLPTRAQVDAFYSTLRAQEEGHGDDTTDGHLEDEHPVAVGPNSHLVTSTSDHEQIYGDCLVTLRALPKLTEYTGCYRNGINSRSWKHHDGGSFAIQKVEFLRHDQAEYVLRRNKRSRLNTWSDQQKWAEWSSHKEVVLDFKDDSKGKKATVESLMS
ncbi:hypothetical protein CJU90_0527 [Yarrowia sp. C11]|nr:hypothetical protein CJU90_0527 [Yarrowia sp. C11]